MMGWEVVPEAVEDAKRNAEINGIVNADFYLRQLGETERVQRRAGTLEKRRMGERCRCPTSSSPIPRDQGWTPRS